jgi:hypothetical protein
MVAKESYGDPTPAMWQHGERMAAGPDGPRGLCKAIRSKVDQGHGGMRRRFRGHRSSFHNEMTIAI